MKKLCAVLLALAFAAPSSVIALTPTRIGTDVSTTRTTGSFTDAFNITVDGTGSNKAIIRFANIQGGGDRPLSAAMIAGATTGDFTQIAAMAAEQQTGGNAWYFLLGTNSGSSTITVTWDRDTGRRSYFAAVYQDMAQASSSLGTVVGETSGSASHPTVGITAPSESVVIAWTGTNSGLTSITADAPGDEWATGHLNGVDMDMNAADQPSEAGGSVTSGFTFNTSTSFDMFVIALKAEAAAPAASGETSSNSQAILVGL